MKQIISAILFVLLMHGSFAQRNDSLAQTVNKKRIVLVSSSLAVGYVSSLYLLNQAWYADYPKSKFHLFNDNKEWLQMDKMGHVYTSYTIANLSVKLMSWTGLPHKQAVWTGAVVAPLYMSTIEILDGYSNEWGFSIGDFTANMVGAAFAVQRNLKTKNNNVLLKWSFHDTKFGSLRPDLFGSTKLERMLKDYNGQTYWLSVGVSDAFKWEKCPKWLSLSVGYSADGMTGGMENPTEVKGKAMPDYKRVRQYYLSLDVNLDKIKTKNKLVKQVFHAVNMLKFPCPALEYSDKKIKGHFFYF